MNELDLVRDFRSELADEDPGARDAAWRDLTGRIEVAGFPAPPRSRLFGRRGMISLATGTAAAAVAAGLLLVGGGPKAGTAAAEALKQTAAVAVLQPPHDPPRPGQFVYTRTRSLNLEVWDPRQPISANPGRRSLLALLPSTSETWIAPDGAGRYRQTLGSLHFPSARERKRWVAAGSPLPPNYANRDGGDRKMGKGGFYYFDPSKLPTDPAKLRRRVEAREIPGVHYGYGHGGGTEQTFLVIWGLLRYSYASPEFRAAAFRALAELPDAHFDERTRDLLGRPGAAVGYVNEVVGIRTELIFDPETSDLLGERTIVLEPELARFPESNLIAGETMNDVAYLESRVVDSMSARR